MKIIRLVLALFPVLVLIACSQDPKIDDQPAEPVFEEDLNATSENVQPLEALNGPAYEGVWAEQRALCDTFPGSADPSPVVITEQEYIEYENRCLIGNAEEGTEGGWRLGLVCNSDGIEYTETLDLDVDGEMLRMRRQDGDENIFVRCTEL